MLRRMSKGDKPGQHDERTNPVARPVRPPSPSTPPPTSSGPRALTQHQKQLDGSGFADSAEARRRATMLGNSTSGPSTLTELPAAVVAKTTFDGKVPAPGVTSPDVWKGLTPPVQSTPGHRSGALLQQVIAQFAVGANPRYEPDAPGKSRGHIFLWDVSRAMGCEVPHFVGARELSVAQTCDWLRHEGPMRGWRKLNEQDLFKVAGEGFLVIALPRELKFKQLAVIEPQPVGYKPLVTGAGLVRGSKLGAAEVLGVRLLDFYAHE
jgi:hypothetical protein